MRKEALEKLIAENLTQRQIAERAGVAQISIRYWLKKYGLKTNHLERRYAPRTARKCIACGETEVAKFYGSRWNRCISCDDARTKQRTNSNRDFALGLLGRVCVEPNCGVDTPLMLDVHHTNAGLKDHGFAQMRAWSRDRIVEELSTCVLLCKNHHALEHDRIRKGKQRHLK